MQDIYHIKGVSFSAKSWLQV